MKLILLIPEPVSAWFRANDPIVVKLRGSLDAANEEVRASALLASTLRDELTAARGELSQHGQANYRLQNDLNAANKQLTEARKLYGTLDRTYNNTLAELQGKDQTIKEMAAGNELLQAKCSEFSAEVDRLTAVCQRLDSRIHEIKRKDGIAADKPAKTTRKIKVVK